MHLFSAQQRMKKNSDLSKADVIIGTCPDMCSEKERYIREEQHRLSKYEMMRNDDVRKFSYVKFHLLKNLLPKKLFPII